MPLVACALLSSALFFGLSGEAFSAFEEFEKQKAARIGPALFPNGRRTESQKPLRENQEYPRELMNLIHDSIKPHLSAASGLFKAGWEELQRDLEENVLSNNWGKRQITDFLREKAITAPIWGQVAALTAIPYFLTEEDPEAIFSALSLMRGRIARRALRPHARTAAISGAGRILRAFPLPESEKNESFYTIKDAISDSSANGLFIQAAMREAALLLKAWDMPLAQAQEALYHISWRIFDGESNGHHTSNAALEEAHKILQEYNPPLKDAQRVLDFSVLRLLDGDSRVRSAKLSLRAIRGIFERYKLPEEDLERAIEALMKMPCKELAREAADIAAKAVFRGLLSDGAAMQLIAERRKALSGADERAGISSIHFFNRMSRLIINEQLAGRPARENSSIAGAVREAVLDIEEIFTSSDHPEERKAAMLAVSFHLGRGGFSPARQLRSLKLTARLLHSKDQAAGNIAQKILEHIFSTDVKRHSLEFKLQARQSAAEALAEDPPLGKSRSLAVLRAADRAGLPVDGDIVFLMLEFVSHSSFYLKASDYLLEMEQNFPGTLGFSHASELLEMLPGAADGNRGAALELIRHILKKGHAPLSEGERLLLSLEINAAEKVMAESGLSKAPADDKGLSSAARRCKEALN